MYHNGVTVFCNDQSFFFFFSYSALSYTFFTHVYTTPAQNIPNFFFYICGLFIVTAINAPAPVANILETE